MLPPLAAQVHAKVQKECSESAPSFIESRVADTAIYCVIVTPKFRQDSRSISDKYMGIIEKQEVKTKVHSNVQFIVPCLPLSFEVSCQQMGSCMHLPLPVVLDAGKS